MTEAEQIQFIKDNYLIIPVKKMAGMIKRSGCFVSGRMKKMGLVVPADIIAKRKADSRYQKGVKPFNKGRKQKDYMSPEAIERNKKTRFKKGNEPHNTKYDFHISVRNSKGNNYYWIRMGKGHYVLLHRYLWEMVNGPLEEGENVQFKDGNPHNIEIENLYLVTRKNQAVVNKKGGKKLPFEIRKSIELINQIKSKINAKQDNRPQ